MTKKTKETPKAEMTLDQRLDHQIRITTSRKLFYRNELIKKMRGLIHDLNREIEIMEKDETYYPNSLGIVQRQGDDVDIYCQKLANVTEILKEILDVKNG